LEIETHLTGLGNFLLRLEDLEFAFLLMHYVPVKFFDINCVEMGVKAVEMD